MNTHSQPNYNSNFCVKQILEALGVVHTPSKSVEGFVSARYLPPQLQQPIIRPPIIPENPKSKVLEYANKDILAEKERQKENDRVKKAEVERKEMQKKKKEAQLKKQKEEEQVKQRDRKKKEEEQKERLRKLQEQARRKQEEIKRQQEQRIQRQKQEEQRAKEEEDRRVEEEREMEQKKKRDRQLEGQKKDARLETFKNASSSLLLDLLCQYANAIVEGEQINCAINSVGDIKKVTRDLLIWTDSFIEKIDLSNQSQVNTLCVKLWNVITNELIMKARKDGLEVVPPTRIDAEIFKNCINAYCLMINVLRVKGLEKVWLYQVGKTLGLLDFIYKRKEGIDDFKNLDLVSKGYVRKFGDNFQNIYMSRLDQLSYFLFGLLLMNPFSCFMEVAQLTNNMSEDVRSKVNQLNKPWDYSVFWMLISEIRSLPFKYFKPICYSNILSILNTHMVEAKTSGNHREFLDIYALLVKDALLFQRQQANDPQMKILTDIVVDATFDGDSFGDLMYPIKNLGKEKKKLMQNANINEVNRKGSVFYYFKSEER